MRRNIYTYTYTVSSFLSLSPSLSLSLSIYKYIIRYPSNMVTFPYGRMRMLLAYSDTTNCSQIFLLLEIIQMPEHVPGSLCQVPCAMHLAQGTWS